MSSNTNTIYWQQGRNEKYDRNAAIEARANRMQTRDQLRETASNQYQAYQQPQETPRETSSNADNRAGMLSALFGMLWISTPPKKD